MTPCCTPAALGCLEQACRFAQFDGQRLFRKHVLAPFDRLHERSEMQIVGQAIVDHGHVGRLDELLE